MRWIKGVRSSTTGGLKDYIQSANVSCEPNKWFYSEELLPLNQPFLQSSSDVTQIDND